MGKVSPNAATRRRTFIREWRKDRGLSLDALAERIGVSKGSLSQLENGHISYTQGTLEAIADALACQPQDLLARDPSDPEGLWAIYESLTSAQRIQAAEILKTFKKTSR